MFLIAAALRLVVLSNFLQWMHIGHRTKTYALWWCILSLPVWLCQAAATVEIFRLICEHYPQLGRFAEVLSVFCFTTATVVGCILAIQQWPHSKHVYLWLDIAVAFGKWNAWACALVPLLQSLVLRLFPVRLSPNLTLHRRAMLVYNLSLAGAWSMATATHPDLAMLANLAMQSLATATAIVEACNFWQSREYIPWVARTASYDEVLEARRIATIASSAIGNTARSSWESALSE